MGATEVFLVFTAMCAGVVVALVPDQIRYVWRVYSKRGRPYASLTWLSIGLMHAFIFLRMVTSLGEEVDYRIVLVAVAVVMNCVGLVGFAARRYRRDK